MEKSNNSIFDNVVEKLDAKAKELSERFSSSVMEHFYLSLDLAHWEEKGVGSWFEPTRRDIWFLLHYRPARKHIEMRYGHKYDAAFAKVWDSIDEKGCLRLWVNPFSNPLNDPKDGAIVWITSDGERHEEPIYDAMMFACNYSSDTEKLDISSIEKFIDDFNGYLQLIALLMGMLVGQKNPVNYNSLCDAIKRHTGEKDDVLAHFINTLSEMENILFIEK